MVDVRLVCGSWVVGLKLVCFHLHSIGEGAFCGEFEYVCVCVEWRMYRMSRECMSVCCLRLYLRKLRVWCRVDNWRGATFNV